MVNRVKTNYWGGVTQGRLIEKRGKKHLQTTDELRNKHRICLSKLKKWRKTYNIRPVLSSIWKRKEKKLSTSLKKILRKTSKIHLATEFSTALRKTSRHLRGRWRRSQPAFNAPFPVWYNSKMLDWYTGAIKVLNIWCRKSRARKACLTFRWIWSKSLEKIATIQRKSKIRPRLANFSTLKIYMGMVLLIPFSVG